MIVMPEEAVFELEQMGEEESAGRELQARRIYNSPGSEKRRFRRGFPSWPAEFEPRSFRRLRGPPLVSRIAAAGR
jgi:hypothetical protein